eukprot:12429893-Karenia_brevis.AAC.1
MDDDDDDDDDDDKSRWFSKIFVLPTNLQTIGNMMAILANMPPNLTPKPSTIGTKIDPEAM